MSTSPGDVSGDKEHSDGRNLQSDQDPAAADAEFSDSDADTRPTQRARRRKWLILGGAIVVVAGIVIGVSVWHFTSSRTTNSPSEAMETYLKAIKDRDASQADKVVCNKITKGKGLKVSGEYKLAKFEYSLNKPQKISSMRYRVTVNLDAVFTRNGEKAVQKNTPTYEVIKEAGDWKVCGFASENDASKPGASGTDSR